MPTKKEIAKEKAIKGGMPTNVADNIFRMQMGSKETYSPTAFSKKDQGVMAMSTMYQTELEPGMQGYFRQEKNKGRDAESIRADLNTPSIKVPDSNYRTNYEVAETLFPGSVSDSNLLESMDTSAYNVSGGDRPLNRKPVRRDDGTVTYTYGDGVGTTKKKTPPKSKKREKVSAFDVPKSKGVVSLGETLPKPKASTSSTAETKKETTQQESQRTQALKPYERRQNIRGVKVSEREYRRQLRKTRRGKGSLEGLSAAKGNLAQAREQLKQAQTVRSGKQFVMPMQMSFRKKNKK